MPLHRHHLESPLPDEPSLVLRYTACQAVHSCRPCRSTRLRRFTPPGASQVCCTLQPIMGFAVFRSTRARLEVVRDEAGSPLQRMPFEAFPSQAAVTRHRAPCPPVVALEARSTIVLRHPRPLLRSPNLRALLHLRSRSERSTVASRVLPVASLGFSFQCVSCPTRHSSELRAHSSRQAERWGTSRSPKANPGPAATVADGADRLCRAEPASRTPRKASLAETADTCFRTCHPLCSCWRRCAGRTPCALSVRHPKIPAAPDLTAGFSVHTTQAIHTKGTSSRSPERSVYSKASLASHRATARLTSRSDLSSSLVDVQCRCRQRTNPGYRAVGDRRWWTPPAPTGNRRPCQRLTRFPQLRSIAQPSKLGGHGAARYSWHPCGSSESVAHYKEANGGVVLRKSGAAAPPCVRPVGRVRLGEVVRTIRRIAPRDSSPATSLSA